MPPWAAPRPPIQHVGRPQVMIASFGNLTLFSRVEFPKLAIMSFWLVVLVPDRHREAQVNTARAHARPGPGLVDRRFATGHE